MTTATRTGSVNGILEAYTTEDLKEKISSLEALLKSVDVRSKQPILAPFSSRAVLQPKHFCVDCNTRLKTPHAIRCNRCNMRLVGKNHIETRKKKGGL